MVFFNLISLCLCLSLILFLCLSMNVTSPFKHGESVHLKSSMQLQNYILPFDLIEFSLFFFTSLQSAILK